MGNNKKKKIILISSLVTVLLIISLLLILFFTTNMFKSPQQLFYKYLSQNAELFDIASSNLKAAYSEKMNQNSYTTEGEISLNYKMGDGDVSESDSNTELFKALIEGKIDNQNKKQYNKVMLTKNNQELLAIKYLRTGDLYALTSDEIVTKYVAVENNNLKELATKLGLQDVSQIPDKLEENNDLENLLKLTDEEKEYISNSYGKLVFNNIDKNKFTQTKKVNVTIAQQSYQAQKYTLTLNTQEIKDLTIKIVQQLQNDDKLLNIILNKYNVIAQNQEMTIGALKQQIQELEQNIKAEDVVNKQVQISLYVLDDKLIKTDVIIGESLITIQYNNNAKENRIIIKNETTNIEGFNTIELKKTENEEQYGLTIVISNSGNAENMITLQTSRVGNVNSNTLRELTILTINAENSVYSLKYSNNINFGNDIQIESLTQDNSITLNSYSKEEINNLITGIIARTTQVWNEKIQTLGNIGNTAIIEDPTNTNLSGEQQTEMTSTQKLAIDMFNKQFLEYLGEKVSSDKVKQLLQVTKTAIENQNPIRVRFSGTYNNTAIEKEVSTIEELEALEIYIVNGKSYFVQGIAESTGKLTDLVIRENIDNNT